MNPAIAAPLKMIDKIPLTLDEIIIDDEKYHFKFVKAETSRDGYQLYRIQPANSTSSYVYNYANGSNAKISSNSSFLYYKTINIRLQYVCTNYYIL